MMPRKPTPTPREKEQAELQVVFDRVAKHLIRQGRKSRTFDFVGACRYRGADGTKCAIGCLISDDVYSENGIEYRTILNPSVQSALRESGIPLPNRAESRMLSMLQSLQRVHDQHDPEEWPKQLALVARARTLSTKGIPTS